jgi:nucleoside-diphosphate-sugar epimerase
VDAALASNITTLIYPGIVFGYPDSGNNWIDARTPMDSLRLIQSSLKAEVSVQRFTESGRRGIVLRMGAFYGPSSQHMRDILRAARFGMAMFVGAGDAYQPLIWIDDAAEAVVAALSNAPGGIYDIVDDEPKTRSELASILAAAMGKRWLLRPPTFVLRLFAGKDAMFLARSQRVSNRRFREATGWKPSIPDAREGITQLIVSAGASDEHRRKYISKTETVSVLRGVSDARQRR